MKSGGPEVLAAILFSTEILNELEKSAAKYFQNFKFEMADLKFAQTFQIWNGISDSESEI